MLAVCVGLMSDPKLLVLDEPSLGLAPIVIGGSAARYGRLREEKLTVLLVEQERQAHLQRRRPHLHSRRRIGAAS